MTETDLKQSDRVLQGDVYGDIEYVERVSEGVDESGSFVELTKLVFPLAVVLTQDCDLLGDYSFRNDTAKKHNKYLISCILAPAYNYEHFRLGKHLEKIKYEMELQNRDKRNLIETNQSPRYHYLEFDSKVPIVPKVVVDFKHYFTIHVEELEAHKSKNFICHIEPVYREDLSQRFAAFLSRIGLPGVED